MGCVPQSVLTHQSRIPKHNLSKSRTRSSIHRRSSAGVNTLASSPLALKACLILKTEGAEEEEETEGRGGEVVITATLLFGSVAVA